MTGLARTHGGDVAALAAASGLPEAAIVDASASINPLGPPDWLDAAFAEGRRKSGHYPDPACRSLREAAAGALHIPPECLVFGNGADDLMFALARTLASVSYWDRRDDGDRASDSVGFGDRANAGYDGKGDNRDRAGNKPVHLVEAPSYASYRDAAEGAGCAVWSLPARMPTAFGSTEASGAETDEARYNDALTSSPPGSVLWLGAPNNPTGVMPADYPGMVVRLAMRHPNHYIVCDEAFLDFVSTTTIRSAGIAATEQQNLIVVSSMTKFWAVPGLRIGYTVCSPKLAARLRAALPSWPLNAVAEVFARMAF
ncbi:MAG: aminotransferase class I/II-fold pyridoxal phosphate-dependent enzyme, partial [Spirochaetales bacterium]|nr:aminotransferase class I/II-fold pyridoxal phosphate-dependent enzyme [Spirochaetales bacterium]